MSGPDAGEDDRVQRFGTIVVVGGGCCGSYYVRQLRRAAKADALTATRILVVDRDPACAVARDLGNAENDGPPVEIFVEDWTRFFAAYLDAAVANPDDVARDAIVPSPLMPHLMGEWLVAKARARFGRRVVADEPFEHLPSVPWERAGAPGTHYVSFATWTCPINCVEPRTCPHTRDTRSWSLPVRLTEHAAERATASAPLVAATLFCRHRSYGVGMFDTAEVIAGHSAIVQAGERGSAEVIIGTVSHCHGALTRLRIRALAELADSPVP